jgi:cytochrome P450
MQDVVERELRSWPRGEPLRVWPRMQAITLEIIMRTVFGVSEAARLDRLREVLRNLLDFTTDRLHLFVLAALGPRRIGRVGAFRNVLDPVDAAVLDEIRRRRADPAVGERPDILSMLVQARHENGEPMSDGELRDELLTLLVAGHETTATALTWALERLVRHPEMLERLSSGDEDYLDAVVKETLRLRPVLPIVVRRLTEQMEIGGHTLPAGVSVTPCIYLMHRRPELYPEPERFRPERFLESPPGTYTWIPFGGGVRRCLGASFALFEMKTVLRAIAVQGNLRPARAESERVTRRAITLTPSRGGEVVLA